ncbi:MAG: NUDIX hydrolase [Hellea sp.]|nr:NUDIX hydrolase [Hellea sp.]
MKIPEIILTDKEKAQRAKLDRAARPRIAATIVLYSGDRKNPKILMGQRARRHDFMPSVYVFPGGRVDRADNYAQYCDDLPRRTEKILEAAYAPRKARACVLAAIRETWEETGIMLGQKGDWHKNLNHKSWDAFRQANIIPDLSNIEVFGRAITPPHRHKRFDTWFFAQPFNGNLAAASDSHELLNVDWFTFDQIKELKIHRATTMMLRVLKDFLEKPALPSDVFYSRMEYQQYKVSRFPE